MEPTPEAWRDPAHEPLVHGPLPPVRYFPASRRPRETAPTCAGFPTHATTWVAARSITIERVLNDNAPAHTKNGIRHTFREDADQED